MAEVLAFRSPSSPSDTASPPLVADDAARQSALDTHASWIVEAPAGSGKTGLLLQRYLKLLAEGNVAQPEEVLAITFTRKATAELRTRVLAVLEAARHNSPLHESASTFDHATRALATAVLARDRALNWSLLANPQRLRIRTIDSVCADIANALPLLSGSSGTRTPLENAAPLYRLAAQHTLLQLGGGDAALNDSLRTVLLHRDGNLADCESLLAGMLAAREQWAELVPLDRALLDDATLEAEVRPRLEKSLEAIVCAGLAHTLNSLPPRFLRDLTALAQRLSIEPGYNGADSPIAFCSDRASSPEARAEHLDHWIALIDLLLTKDGSKRRGFNVNHLGFSLPKSEKAHLESLIAELDDATCEALCSVRRLPPARYPDDQWRIAKALFRLLLHALAELKVVFSERSECDFAELALAARQVLRSEHGADDLDTSAGAGLRHLLVDEMQDTSSSQYELIELLTQSWDGHSQTLFLVGDPKQSIYLFRQARVERFLRTMHEGRLGTVTLRPLYLTSNFRSQADLVRGFNRDFNRIFPLAGEAHSDAVDVPFVEASAVRAPSTGDGIVWHTAVLTGNDESSNAKTDPKRDHTLQEARSMRRIIEKWQRKPLPADRRLLPDGSLEPWRIAVLARARHHLAPILAEFQRNDGGREPIPFRAVNVEALDERPEVLDALALTRALLHPADRIAWLAVLHAPWCGLGLADLLALTGEGPTADARATVPSLIAANADRLSATGRELLRRAWPTLQTALARSGRESVAVSVERTWRSLGGDASLRLEQLANVQRLFDLLRDLEQPGGWLDLSALKSSLNGLYAEPAAAENAVDLMTIHGAKGLEWDVVLVPALERRSQSSRSELLNWLEFDTGNSDEASIVLAPIHGKGDSPGRLFQWLNSVRLARDRAERKRLYYVACTRAREELHLFAACKRDKNQQLQAPPATLLAACWPAAEEHFANASELVDQLVHSLEEIEEDSQPLALAASASALEVVPAPASAPLLRRLPLTFDPLERFAVAAAHALPYTPASALRHAPAFERPDGSFAVRAFGSVVHRFLQVVAATLAQGETPDTLLAQLPSWGPRLLAGLRAAGLPPTLCRREAPRALHALTSALADPIGRWLLSPRAGAASEHTLTFASPGASILRTDRTFLAGSVPFAKGESFLWIVDFKTTERGARDPQIFGQQEREKYSPQLEAYAAIRRSLADGNLPIMLALYYPLVPQLVFWPASSV